MTPPGGPDAGGRPRSGSATWRATTAAADDGWGIRRRGHPSRTRGARGLGAVGRGLARPPPRPGTPGPGCYAGVVAGAPCAGDVWAGASVPRPAAPGWSCSGIGGSQGAAECPRGRVPRGGGGAPVAPPPRQSCIPRVADRRRSGGDDRPGGRGQRRRAFLHGREGRGQGGRPAHGDVASLRLPSTQAYQRVRVEGAVVREVGDVDGGGEPHHVTQRQEGVQADEAVTHRGMLLGDRVSRGTVQFQPRSAHPVPDPQTTGVDGGPRRDRRLPVAREGGTGRGGGAGDEGPGSVAAEGTQQGGEVLGSVAASLRPVLPS